jgi:polyisoprenoid-binding protein YceI
MRPSFAAAVTLLVAVLTGAAAPAVVAQPSEPANYSLDAGHTFIHWEVLHNGTSTTRGRFDRAAGAVWFDARAQQIDVSITVDTASVSTGQAPFDAVIRGAQMLASAEHPQAFFTARHARWDGEVPREVQGEITLHGVSQPVTLRALRWRCGMNLLVRREVCGGDFEAELKRSDFGVTYALPFAADTVRLLIQVEGVRQ